MEKLWEKLAVIIVAAFAALIIIALSCLIFMPHTFEGYYLNGNSIWASYKWAPNEKACDWTPERWQQILDNDLHLKSQD